MFKKTLLALALAGVATSSYAAKTSVNAGGSLVGSTVGTQTISFEGAVGSKVTPIGDVVVTLGADDAPSYANFSGVTVTVTGGTLAPATDFDIATLDNTTNIASAKVAGTVTYPASNSARLVFAGGDVATAQLLTGTGNADTITIKGLAIVADSFDVGSKISLKIDMNSAIPGSPLQTVNIAAAEVINQFSVAKVTGANLAGVDAGALTMKVDVSDARNSWKDSGNGKDTVDLIGVTVQSAKIDQLAAVATAAKGPTNVLNGAFGFLDADSSGKVDTGTIASATGTPVIASDFSSVTEVGANFGGGNLFNGAAAQTQTETFTVDVAPAGSKVKYVIAPQALTVTSSFEYLPAVAGATVTTASLSTSVGSWDLNGSSVVVPYMPFGTNTQVILRATNTSAVEGDLTVRYLEEGSQNTWKSVGVVTKLTSGVTNIADLVMDAVKADSGLTKGKVALELTTNSPSSAISVYAAYKVVNENDRGFVGTFGAKGAAVQGN